MSGKKAGGEGDLTMDIIKGVYDFAVNKLAQMYSKCEHQSVAEFNRYTDPKRRRHVRKIKNCRLTILLSVTQKLFQ